MKKLYYYCIDTDLLKIFTSFRFLPENSPTDTNNDSDDNVKQESSEITQDQGVVNGKLQQISTGPALKEPIASHCCYPP